MTIIPDGDGFRVLHSRDEQRSRSAEVAPSWRTLDCGLRACWPTDPDAGGTWVAVRSDGLFLGLLNLNLEGDEIEPSMPTPTRSRGLVIPALIGLDSAKAALDAVQSMDLLGMSPFRLVIAGLDDGQSVYAVVRFDGMQLTIPIAFGELKKPQCWASSGLGDSLVQCRLPVFEEMMDADPSPENQRAFHWFQWDDRPEFSVMMSREDARTSSVTTIVVDGINEPTVLYDPIAIGDAICDPVGAGMLR